MRGRQPSTQIQQLLCENWNLKYPVGTCVRVRMDDGSHKETVTVAPAQMLSGHTAVIWLEHIRGCYLLSRVEALL